MADIVINGTAGNDSIQPFGSNLLLTLSATSAQGIWPIINVVVNGVTLAAGIQITASNTAGATQTVSVAIPAGTVVSSLALQYTNDDQTSWATEDRNLFISSISLNGTSISPTSATYVRSADGSVVAGQSAMVWGGELDWGSAALQGVGSSSASGTATIDGGGGIDTVFFTGALSSYSIAHTSGGVTVSGNSQTANMVNVERLHFSDMSVALDMSGHAGTVAKLIAAVFGSSYLGNSQFVGIGLNLMDSGMSESALADLAVHTALFQSLAGSTSNTDFVKFVFHNVVGVDPSASDLSLYVGMLNSGQQTQASMAVMAAEASQNQVHLVGVQGGIDFS
ncbi:MAG: carbohydrate-binding domain-containing protein [Ramlibacter sp.]